MSEDSGLVVIGAGLMRTGTTSLKSALETLLNAPCYHMSTVLMNPEDISWWENAALQGLSDDEWRELLKNYKAAIDMPAAVFYRRLMEVYPNAKVILTVRDPQSWYKSVVNTVMKFRQSMEKLPYNLILYFSPHRNLPKMITLVRKYGNENQNLELENEADAIAFYERHVESVMRTVPSDRLLVFKTSDGWKPLSEFLGKPVPNDPYPHSNATGEFNSNIRSEIGLGLLKYFSKWIFIGSLVALTVHNVQRKK